jgi:hypothetical protein
MENGTIAIGLIAFIVICVAGFFAADILYMSDNASDLEDTSDSAASSACNSALDSYSTMMSDGDTRQIPESCFQNGELVTDRLSNAEPGDQFRKTASGVETVE